MFETFVPEDSEETPQKLLLNLRDYEHFNHITKTDSDYLEFTGTYAYMYIHRFIVVDKFDDTTNALYKVIKYFEAPYNLVPVIKPIMWFDSNEDLLSFLSSNGKVKFKPFYVKGDFPDVNTFDYCKELNLRESINY